MDWTVYWFMLPVCVVIASVAMFSGISGAAMLTPVFLIGFPLMAVPILTTVEAIGTSLVLETAGFGSGVAGYVRRRLPDYRLVRRLLIVTVPFGILGAILARAAPSDTLKGIYGVVMFAVTAVLLSEARRLRSARSGGRGDDDDRAAASTGGSAGARGEDGDGHTDQWDEDGVRHIRASDGRVYRYHPHGIGLTRALTGTGALTAGLISTGVGEATLPNLVRRVHMPVAVAAATSTLVVASTVVGAAVTHLVELALEGGLGAIPWNLLAWAVPGAVVGAQIGTRLQGKIDERRSNIFFAVLFAAIGVAFLLSVTLFSETFETGSSAS